MALTLPYPDLDFVPLDILTAEEMNEIVANYTYIANQFPIESSNLDWASMRIGEKIWSQSNAYNTAYLDNSSYSQGWRGYNFTNFGTVSGDATGHYGTSSQDAIGGGVQLTSSAPTGLYLVSVIINEYNEGEDGYRPFTLLKNTTPLTGDIGVSQRGGSATATVIVELTSGDIVNLQVFASGSGRIVNSRVWMDGYFIRSTS